MAPNESGERWTATVDDGVILFEFLPGMDLSTFGSEAYDVYERFLTRYDVDGLVTVVELDDPFDSDTFDVWEQTAQRAVEAGVTRWATVADGVKAISLRGKMDTEGLDITVTDDRAEAVEWARGK
jgi:hypothetical protein